MDNGLNQRGESANLPEGNRGRWLGLSEEDRWGGSVRNNGLNVKSKPDK